MKREGNKSMRGNGVKEFNAKTFEVIKAYRGLTVNEISNLTGIPNYSLSRYTRRRNLKPTQEQIEKIAAALDVMPAALLCDCMPFIKSERSYYIV